MRTWLEMHQAVALHGPEGTREVGHRPTSLRGQLVQGARVCLSDRREQFPVAFGQHLGQRFERLEPNFRLIGRGLILAFGDGDGPGLVFLARGNTNF